jgi:hypothetical protein
MNYFNISKISLCFIYWLERAVRGRGEREEEGEIIRYILKNPNLQISESAAHYSYPRLSIG